MILSKSQSFVLKVVLPLAFFCVLGVNVLISLYTPAESKEDRIAAAAFGNDHRTLCLLLVKKLHSSGDSSSIDDYDKLLESYQELDGVDKLIVDHQLKKDSSGLQSFAKKNFAGKGKNRSVFFLWEAMYNRAFGFPFKQCLKGVDEPLKYKNLFWSEWCFEHGITDSAVYFMEQEYLMYPRKSIYVKLFDLYLTLNEEDKLTLLISNDGAKYGLGYAERLFFFKNRMLLPYLRALTAPIYSPQNVLLLTISLVVVLVWVFYLKSLKFFRAFEWKYVLLTWLFSAVLSELTLILYDFWSLMGITRKGDLIGDLIYFVAGVGFIEELIKCLSVLLVLWFGKKVIREPLDYLILASVSALGFAFGENVLYYTDNFDAIDTRAMTSTLLHMVLTSVVFYGYVLFKSRNKSVTYLFLTFFSAVCFHGVYDFWLSVEVPFLALFSLLMLFFGSVVWVKISNNLINISPYFQTSQIKTFSSFAIPIIAGLSMVVLVEYFYSIYAYGALIANTHTVTSSIVTVVLISGVVVNLSKISAVKDEWKSLSPFSFNQFFNLERYQGSKISVVFISGPAKSMRVNGIVMEECRFKNDKNYLKVQLQSDITIGAKKFSKIILCPSKPGTTIFDADVTVLIRGFKDDYLIDGQEMKITDFLFLGVAVLNEVHDF